MKIIFSVLLGLALSFNIYAQRLHVSAFVGSSNYSGDLQESRYTLSHSGLARGIGISYDLTPQLSVRAEYSYGKVMGDDKLGTKNVTRNLSFASYISEGQIAMEYYLKDLSEVSASPYIFAGIARFHFNPSTLDTAGNRVYLKYLNTEGQGFYLNRTPYKLTQTAIPFGAGYKMYISERISLGVEVGFRKLFTDYLDDVSTTYVDQNLLFTNMGLKAVEVAYRGDEVKGGFLSYPADGTKRGGSKYKDWYYFTVLKASIDLGNGDFRGKVSPKLGCPNRIY